MNLNEVFKRIEMALAPNEEEIQEVQGASMRLANGVMLEAEAFEAGNNVFLVGEDGEKIPAPVGEHLLEDGRTLVIVEEGIIAEMREAATPEATPTATELADEEISVEVPEAAAPELEQIVEAVVEAVAPAIEEVKEQVEEMKRRFEEIAKKEEEEEKVDMSAAAKRLKAAPKEKKVAMQRYGAKGTQGTLGRVFNKLG